MSKILGVLVLALVGMYVGFYLATTLALDTFIRITPQEQPVLQDLQYSDGSQMFPNVQLQPATSVQ